MREGTLHGGLPYLAVGHGEPLVMLPGLAGENANPTGLARRWQLRAIRPLTSRYRVYLVNRKPGLEPGSTMRDLAADHAAAIRHDFGEPVPVVGTSTGGSVAQQLAIDHPGLVRRLVLADTACRLSPRGREAQRLLAERTSAGQPRRAWAAVGPMLASSAAGGRVMAAGLWLVGARMNPADPGDMLVTIAAEDVFDSALELHRITAPTLVIGGERDRFYGRELFEETAERIPDARLRLFAGKGHGAGASGQRGVREILDFLTAG